MGGENLGVAQNTYSVGWFKGRELNMVFGLQLSFSRVVSTLFFSQVAIHIGKQNQAVDVCFTDVSMEACV